MFQKAIHRLPLFELTEPWFILYRLLADAKSSYLETHFTGAAIKHFTGQELSRYSFGLPPLAEQRRIAAKVSQLMTLCDELEAKLKDAQAASGKLMEATVKHLCAFGEEAQQSGISRMRQPAEGTPCFFAASTAQSRTRFCVSSQP
jgi:type I restriction enzyme, S subunit